MPRALHPIQVKILKLIYNRSMSVYKMSKELNIPTPQVQFHVSQLHKKGFVNAIENKSGRGKVYRANKRKVKIEDEPEGTFIYLKVRAD